MSVKKTMASVLALTMLGSFGTVAPVSADSTDYAVNIVGMLDAATQYGLNNTYTVQLQVQTLNNALLGGDTELNLAYDATVFDPVTTDASEDLNQVSVDAATPLLAGQFVDFSSWGLSTTAVGWTENLRFADPFSGDNMGFISMGFFNKSALRTYPNFTTLQTVRLAFQPGKSLKDVTASTIRLMTAQELTAITTSTPTLQQLMLSDGVNNYYYGSIEGADALNAPAFNLQMAVTSPLASYAPVTLAQTGDVAHNNVQYQTAAAVIAALPASVTVTLANGDTVSVPVAWADTSGYNAAKAGDYVFTAAWGAMPAGANNDNNLAAPAVTVTVAAGSLAPGDVTPPTASGTYGDALASMALTGGSVAGGANGTWAWTAPNAASIYPTAANTAAYSVTFTPDNPDIQPVTVMVTPTVAKKAVTVTADAKTKIYGQTLTSADFSATGSGLVLSDTLASLGGLVMSSTGAAAGAAVGTYDITATPATNGNYNVTFVGAGKLTVVPAAVTAITTDVPDVTVSAYEASSYALSISGIQTLAALPATVNVTTDTGTAALPVTWAESGAYDPKGGTYTFTGTPTGNTNITVPGGMTKTVTVVVTPVHLDFLIFVDETIRVNSNPAMTAADIGLPTSGSALIPGTNVTVSYTITWENQTLDGTMVGSFTRFAGTMTYINPPVWATPLTNTTVSVSIEVIDKSTTTVTVTPPANVTYGTPVASPTAAAMNGSQNFTYSYSGTLAKGGSYGPTSVKPTDAGAYTVTATLVDPDYAGSGSADFTISQAPLTATVNPASAVYGGSIPAFTATYSGFVYGDTAASLATPLTFTTAAAAGSPAGSYDVTSGAGIGPNGNYIVTVSGANALTITKKPITVTADDASRDYLAANPTFTFTANNPSLLVGSDTKADLYVTLTCALGPDAAAGLHTGVITGTSTSANYDVTVIPGNLTINKINQTTPVTVTIANGGQAVLGQTPPAVTASGGNGGGQFTYESSNTAVAQIDAATGALTIIAMGTTQITAVRAGDNNYNPGTQPGSATLTVVPEVVLTASNTAAAGANLANAQNQDKVSFGAVNRVGGANNFTLTVTGTARLVNYTNADAAQGAGAWVGALIGAQGITDITSLWVKTSPTGGYARLGGADVTKAANAGGDGAEFVFWFAVTDSGAGSSHTVYVSTDAAGSNAATLTITFVPYVVPTYTITATAGTGGTVTGSGTYDENANVTLTATPNPGYTFDGWYEGGAKIAGAGATYAFTATANRTIEARFAAIPTYTITVTANPSAGGTVTGNGTYDEGTNVTLTATPNPGYTFDGWYEGGAKIAGAGATYPITVTGNRTLEARFTANPVKTYMLTVTAGIGGTVTGGGRYYDGTNVTLTATPNPGYTFDGWYEGGVKIAGAGATYTFTTTANRTLEARFAAIPTYTITATANPSAGGTVTGGGTYTENANVTLTATPSAGYTFDGWYEGGVKIAGAGATYTFTATANRTLEARFAAIPVPTYTITVTTLGSGAVSGDGTYDEGTNVTLTATPNPGYTFDGWYEGGAKITGAGATYPLTVTGNRTLEARFAAITGPSYTITVTAGVGGSVSGNNITYAEYATVTLVATPDSGYTFDGWYEGGTKIAGAGNPYTFTATASRIIEAVFAATTPVHSYAITVTAGTGGTVAGGGTYAQNASVTLTATPSAGYTFDGWYENGAKIGNASTFMLSATANRTIEARFAAVSPTQPPAVTQNVPPGYGGTGVYMYTTPSTQQIPGQTVPQANPGQPAAPGKQFANPYSDVADSAWYYDAVMYVTQNGIMNGTGGGKFSPDASITRAMFCQILYNSAGSPAVTGIGVFQDVAAGVWFANAVNWASEQGIVLGYGNGMFGPSDLITREQMAVLLYKYAKFKGVDVSAKADLSIFSDADKISDWARPAVEWAVAVSIINGRTYNTAAPQGKATRAEAATIFMRWLDLAIKED